MSNGHSMMMLPAAPGTCAMCAKDHSEDLAHDLTSLFYGMRFKLKYRRNPTWADACAHLTAQQQAAWREAMRLTGTEWTTTPNPIAEPYAISEPLT